MNYKEILSRPVNRIDFTSILQAAIDDTDVFQTIFDQMFDPNEKIAWRSAWICEKVSEKYPDYFSEPAVNKIIELALSTPYTGVQRLTLSMLFNLPLPEEIPVDLINVSFERMVSPKSPTAVQVLSMKLLFLFSRREPDFAIELKSYLESVDADEYTVGYQTARRNILKKLSK